MGSPAYPPIDFIDGYPPEAVKGSAQNFAITFLENLPAGTQRPTIVLSWDEKKSVGELAFEGQAGKELATAYFNSEGMYMRADISDSTVEKAVLAAEQQQLERQ